MDKIFKNLADMKRDDSEEFFISPKENLSFWKDRNIESWRHWRKAPMASFPDLDIKLSGALDDIVVDSGDRLSPFDWKTSSHEPRTGDDGSLIPEYAQIQIELYAIMLEQAGLMVSPCGYIGWIYPNEVTDVEFLQTESIADVKFNFEILKHELDTDRAVGIIKKISKCLGGPVPESSAKCEYCSFISDRKDF